ncbi:hypothetical protein [Ferruginibacter profundus]
MISVFSASFFLCNENVQVAGNSSGDRQFILQTVVFRLSRFHTDPITQSTPKQNTNTVISNNQHPSRLTLRHTSAAKYLIAGTAIPSP